MHISPSSSYSKISLHFNTIPIQFFCTTIALNCLYFSAFMSCPSENQNPWKILKNCFPYAGEWSREKGRWRWLARALEISGKLVWFKRAPAQYWRRIGRKNRGCHKSANGNIRPRDSVRERSITNACYKYCVQSGRESEKGVCYDQKFSGPRRKEERKKGNSATPVNLSVAYLLGNLSIELSSGRNCSSINFQKDEINFYYFRRCWAVHFVTNLRLRISIHRYRWNVWYRIIHKFISLNFWD